MCPIAPIVVPPIHRTLGKRFSRHSPLETNGTAESLGQVRKNFGPRKARALRRSAEVATPGSGTLRAHASKTIACRTVSWFSPGRAAELAGPCGMRQTSRASGWFPVVAGARWNRAFFGPSPKRCGQLLGESWPRANRSGTGRGGDVTGSRNSNSCFASLSAIWRWRWPLPGDRRRARPRRSGRSATAA